MTLTPIAHADFNFAVGVKCDLKNAELTIAFDGIWDDSPQIKLRDAGMVAWSSWSLIDMQLGDDGKYLLHEKPIFQSCEVGGKKYDISIYPHKAVRFHPEGFCATRMGARVVVKLMGEKFVERSTDACTDDVVTKSIHILPDGHVKYEEISGHAFFD